MKLYKKLFILLGIALLSGCEDNPAYVPQCYVQQDSYFTNDPRDMNHVESIGEEYEYYGTIDKLVKGLPNEELSTNSKEYLDKEIYVNKEDDTDIYIKLGNNDYLRLYTE